MKIKVMLLTQNKGKIAAAQLAFNDTNIEIIEANREYFEIQADSSIEIAKYSALEAAKENNVIAIREDHGFFINSLGFPGPYMQFIERVLSVDKLLNILNLSMDRTGYFELGAVIAYPDGTIKDFAYKVPIYLKHEVIVPDSRGGWNSIICFQGEERAFSEYPSSERDHVWAENFKKMAELFKQQ